MTFRHFYRYYLRTTPVENRLARHYVKALWIDTCRLARTIRKENRGKR